MRTRRHYPKPEKDGWTKWFEIFREIRLVCCDCGLVHIHQFRVESTKVQMRVRRAEGLTKIERKKFQKFIDNQKNK